MPIIFVASQNAMTEIFDVWPDQAQALGLTTQTMAPAISSYRRHMELRDRYADHIRVVRQALEIDSGECHAFGSPAR